ncbi:MAG TPA: hypothetical protein PKC43_11640 [Phycisphaerales bacterium]|nr:hypothetical protein [Phycisphaerales bacterium]HMP38085.1 hypothetical protein [Phycisphaerales bacterium]
MIAARLPAMLIRAAALLVAAAFAVAAPAHPGRSVVGPESERGAAAALVESAQAAFRLGTELLTADPAASRRQFEESAAGFEQAIALVGETPGLLLNLGNANLKAGRLGPAILALRNARLLDPSDARIALSLDRARALQRDRIAAEPEGVWGQLLAAAIAPPPALRQTALILVNVCFWGLLALRLVRPVPLALIIVLGVATLAGAATILLDRLEARPGRHAVLMVDNAVLRRGSGESFAPAITERPSQGLELRVVALRPGWVQVRLPDGAEGWMRDDQVAPVGGGFDPLAAPGVPLPKRESGAG